MIHPKYPFLTSEVNFVLAGKYAAIGLGTFVSISSWVYQLLKNPEALYSSPKFSIGSLACSNNLHCLVRVGDNILDGRLVQDTFVLAKYFDLVRKELIKYNSINQLLNSLTMRCVHTLLWLKAINCLQIELI